MKRLTVKQLLLNKMSSSEIKVFQVPIKEIEPNIVGLVKRYEGEVSVALNSNQNYLDFEIEYLYHDDGYLVIICKANKEQERRIVNAYRSKAY